MSILGMVKYPKWIIRGVAMKLLLERFEESPSFANDREAIYNKYRSVLLETKNYAIKMFQDIGLKFAGGKTTLEDLAKVGLATMALKNFDFEKQRTNFLTRVPQAKDYLHEYIGLCSRHHFDYDWAPSLLFCEDMQKESNVDLNTAHIALSIWLGMLTGMQPFTAIVLPSSVVYLETRPRIHKFIDSILDDIPRDPSWRDDRHSLKLHVKWLHANKAIGMSYYEIYNEADLNPFSANKDEDGPRKIGRAIRKLHVLLGGTPLQRGRPKGSAT